MIRFPRSGLGLLFPVLALFSCRFSRTPDTPPPSLSQRITWEGRAATGYSKSIPDGADSLSRRRAIRSHQVEFSGGSVRLRLDEYVDASSAFADFQASATQEDMKEGFRQAGDTLVFAQGKYLCHFQGTYPGMAWGRFLRQNLSFQGENLFAKPKEFEAFPLLGKIPHSERVISKHFLGRNWEGPVFTVSYRCHADTGTAFRASLQKLRDGDAWETPFQGWDEFHRPLILWILEDGLMGFSGCFDPLLAQEYALKMKKTAVLWSKP